MEYSSCPISYIYGLYSTRNTEIIRYIGYSYNPIKRLTGHFNEAKSMNKYHRHRWILNEIANGYEIKFIILRVLPEHEIQKGEIETIALFKAIGADLVNGNGGGLGGRNPSKESKERARLAKLGNKWNVGRKHSKQFSEGISKRMKGRKKPQEGIDKAKETRRLNNSYRKGKLTEEIIKEIYRLYNEENKSIGMISLDLNIPKGSLCNIIYNPISYKEIKEKFSLQVNKNRNTLKPLPLQIYKNKKLKI